MRFVLMLCIPAVALWGYALNLSVFTYFSVPLFSEYHHVVTGVVIFFTVITLMIISILISLIRKVRR